jgi:uncharacterized membrane protein YqjE
VIGDEEDYSDYLKHLSSFNSVISVFAGFTFTSLTLLITLLPDPSSIMSQFTLFFLAVLFDLLTFLVAWNSVNVVYFCRKVPPRTKQIATFNWILMLSFDLSGLIIVLVFLLSDLIYLTLASGIVWVLFIIAIFLFTWKPLKEYRKTRAYVLGRVEKKEKYRD